ncbi:MAG: NADH-quinone oxidoreductase subunit NuoH, partial [Chloroflexota bacterium]|nr:NADH-quinone oxidoreductase subunit NuoH [Chloroflexota bacterium]
MGTPLLENYLFRNVYCPLAANQGNKAVCGWHGNGLLPAGWEWLAYFLAGFTIIFMLVNAVLMLGMVYTWTERRVLGRFQSRLGPNRWGPWGLLTPVADAIKLLLKEDIVPRAADRLLFNLAPVLMVVPVFLTLAVVPFAHNTFLADLNIGVLFVPAVGAMTTLAIFTAGWSSSTRYALFGAMRGVAQLISYEIPVVLALAGVVLLAGSMSLTRVVDAQGVPFLLVQPLGAFIFLVGTSAELNRTPFDIVEAESEIIAGYHIEYSGMKWGLFQLAEFAAVLVASALLATFYLGGWSGPFASGQLGLFWFMAKVALFTFLFIWIRATLPRLRVDQIMAFAWKFLFPMSLVNVFAGAVEVYLLRDPST